MKYKYCPNCGRKLTKIECGDDGMVPYCDACQKRWFDSFQSIVLVLTYNEYDEVVLARQEYLSTKYDIFTSGFMTPGETAEETAIREVKEELGLDIEKLTYAGTYWMDGQDMLVHGFVGFARKKEIVLSEEVDSARWVPILEAPKTMFPDRPGNCAHAIYRKLLEVRGIGED